jgi:hypothetical protein
MVTDLRLHGDDVYFTLENTAQDGAQQREGGVSSNPASSKVPFHNSIYFELLCCIWFAETF